MKDAKKQPSPAPDKKKAPNPVHGPADKVHGPMDKKTPFQPTTPGTSKSPNKPKH